MYRNIFRSKDAVDMITHDFQQNLQTPKLLLTLDAAIRSWRPREDLCFAALSTLLFLFMLTANAFSLHINTIAIHQSFEMTGKLRWHVQEKHASNHVVYNYTTLHQQEQIMYPRLSLTSCH